MSATRTRLFPVHRCCCRFGSCATAVSCVAARFDTSVLVTVICCPLCTSEEVGDHTVAVCQLGPDQSVRTVSALGISGIEQQWSDLGLACIRSASRHAGSQAKEPRQRQHTCQAPALGSAAPRRVPWPSGLPALSQCGRASDVRLLLPSRECQGRGHPCAWAGVS